MTSRASNYGVSMLRPSAAFVGACVAVAFAFASAPPAAAQNDSSGGASSGSEQEAASSEDFDTLIKRGREAYANKNWKDSAEAFQKAYQIKPVANLLYNIGRVYENAGEFKKAVKHYEKFVNQPGIDIDNRKDALDRIETLEQIINYSEREKKAAENKKSTEPGGEPGGDPGVSPAPENDYTLALVLLSAGGAGLISGSVFGILTANAHSDFQSADNLEARRDAADRGTTFGTVADVLLISGGALTAAGFGLFIWPLQSQPATDQEARLQPVIGPNQAGLQLDVRF